jgi:hypothetical protein
VGDIHSEISWEQFQLRYVDWLNAYNIYVSGGVHGQREAIHAHHFPVWGEREACAPAPECVTGMLSNRNGVIEWYLSMPRLSVVFDRLVQATGFNPAMVLIPRSPLSIFNAFAASHYAIARKGAAKTDEYLLKLCVKWLMVDDCKNACNSTNSLSTTQPCSTTTVRSRCLLDVWCEIMSHPVDTHVVSKKLKMHQNLSEISFTLAASYTEHFPKLNELFVMALCEIFNCAVTILDNAFGKVCTYRGKGKLFAEKHHIVVLKVDDDEYFGVFDLDSHVK